MGRDLPFSFARYLSRIVSDSDDRWCSEEPRDTCNSFELAVVRIRQRLESQRNRNGFQNTPVGLARASTRLLRISTLGVVTPCSTRQSEMATACGFCRVSLGVFGYLWVSFCIFWGIHVRSSQCVLEASRARSSRRLRSRAPRRRGPIQCRVDR